MSRLFRPLLVAGLVIAGLGTATAVSIFDEDGLKITVVDEDEKESEDLVDDEALDGVSYRTAEPPTPSPGPARQMVSRPKMPPVTEAVSGPRAPRDRAVDGGATNPPGSGDRAVGVGPDINDGQGLPADPTDE